MPPKRAALRQAFWADSVPSRQSETPSIVPERDRRSNGQSRDRLGCDYSPHTQVMNVVNVVRDACVDML